MLVGFEPTGVISNFLGKGLDVLLSEFIVKRFTMSSASSAAFFSLLS